MPCRTMCTVCGFAALSHSYFIRLYKYALHENKGRLQNRNLQTAFEYITHIISLLSHSVQNDSALPHLAQKKELDQAAQAANPPIPTVCGSAALLHSGVSDYSRIK
ncbi:hypothetical protein D0T90_10570 [Neisseria animalis]|uniref:Uncharacterized protein n=1 Tax=Neisseria animalis TaxID=492 RepID=A0A5P3MW26_NEIAN|nr:hypothetical protein D0T90_10570 [Neisseria animalis]ROW32389.1 hypothetical protein CGZ60_04525 [Neisseria animalis]